MCFHRRPASSGSLSFFFPPCSFLYTFIFTMSYHVRIASYFILFFSVFAEVLLLLPQACGGGASDWVSGSMALGSHPWEPLGGGSIWRTQCRTHTMEWPLINHKNRISLWCFYDFL
jgi:hypothetical protein